MRDHDFVIRALNVGGKHGRRMLANMAPFGWLVEANTLEIIRPALENELSHFRYLMAYAPRGHCWPPPGAVGFQLKPFTGSCDGPLFTSTCGRLCCSIALIPGAFYVTMHIGRPRAGMQETDDEDEDGLEASLWAGASRFEIALDDVD